MDPVRRSLLELNVTVVLLGVVPLFAKLIELGAVSIIGWRAVLGGLALIVFIGLRRGGFGIASRRDAGLVTLLGVVMAVHWVMYFQAIQVSTVAVAVVSMFTWPVMAVLLEPLIFRSGYRLADLGLAVCALVGVALVVPEFSLHSSALQGAAWGLVSALLFALRNILHRRYLAGYPAVRMMAFQLVVVALCLAPFMELPDAGTDWWLLVLLGLVFTACAHTLLVGTMRELKAKTVGMISCLQPVYGIAAAALLLNELPTWRGLLGALVVFAVAVVETVRAPGEARRLAAERR
jgi:drug/metabolite transporter (DMT)-like permease